MMVQLDFLKIKEGNIIILSNGVILKILRLNNSSVKLRILYYPLHVIEVDYLTFNRLDGNLGHELIVNSFYIFRRDFTVKRDLFTAMYYHKTDYMVINEAKHTKQIQSTFNKHISPFDKIEVRRLEKTVNYVCD